MLLRIALLIGLSLASSSVFAKTCALAISGTDAMKYDKTELKIDADCTEVELTLTHAGKLQKTAMGHGWVLSKTADIEAIAKDGLAAGPGSDYIKSGDDRVIAHTKIIGGGESTSIKFSTSGLTKGGDYSFFCPFPGHHAVMKGKFIFG
jgi:azurin